jgi:hypothetical protein
LFAHDSWIPIKLDQSDISDTPLYHLDRFSSDGAESLRNALSDYYNTPDDKINNNNRIAFWGSEPIVIRNVENEVERWPYYDLVVFFQAMSMYPSVPCNSYNSWKPGWEGLQPCNLEKWQGTIAALIKYVEEKEDGLGHSQLQRYWGSNVDDLKAWPYETFVTPSRASADWRLDHLYNLDTGISWGSAVLKDPLDEDPSDGITVYIYGEKRPEIHPYNQQEMEPIKYIEKHNLDHTNREFLVAKVDHVMSGSDLTRIARSAIQKVDQRN